MNHILPKRKPNRLSPYDYSQDGAYFITVCTQHRKRLFWNEDMTLSVCGQMVEQAIGNISKQYPMVWVDQYVIMPDHVHLILRISSENGLQQKDGRPMVAPMVSRVIQQFKGYVTKTVGYPIWQKSFNDRVIRNETDYQEIWKYIQTNPDAYQITP